MLRGSLERNTVKKHIPTALIIVTMLGCTAWLTYLHEVGQEEARVDLRSNMDKVLYRVVGSPYQLHFYEANLATVLEDNKEILEAVEALDEKMPGR